MKEPFKFPAHLLYLALPLPLLLIDPSQPHLNLAALIWIQILPLIQCIKKGAINLLALAMISQCLLYSWPRIDALLFGSAALSDSSLAELQMLLLASYLSILAFYLFEAKWSVPSLNTASIESPALHTTTIGTCLLLVSYPLISAKIPASLHLPALILQFCALAALFSAHTSDRLLQVARLSALFICFLAFVQTASLSSGVVLIIILFFKFLTDRHPKTLALLLSTVFVMAVLQSVKFSLRQSYAAHKPKTLIAKTIILTETARKHLNGESFNQLRSMNIQSLSTMVSPFRRIGDNSLSFVISNTPGSIPYWKGRSYSFNPRNYSAIKNTFGRRYGILATDDFTTTVDYSYLAEAYMNFGMPAFLFAAVFYGWILAFVQRVALFAAPRGMRFLFFSIPFLFTQHTATILCSLCLILVASLAWDTMKHSSLIRIIRGNPSNSR